MAYLISNCPILWVKVRSLFYDTLIPMNLEFNCPNEQVNKKSNNLSSVSNFNSSDTRVQKIQFNDISFLQRLSSITFIFLLDSANSFFWPSTAIFFSQRQKLPLAWTINWCLFCFRLFCHVGILKIDKEHKLLRHKCCLEDSKKAFKLLSQLDKFKMLTALRNSTRRSWGRKSKYSSDNACCWRWQFFWGLNTKYRH
jgi:hypothetical protein